MDSLKVQEEKLRKLYFQSVVEQVINSRKREQRMVTCVVLTVLAALGCVALLGYLVS